MTKLAGLKSVQQTIKTGARAKPWMPRFWSGMTPGPWFRLLRRNHYRVSPSRWAMAGIITGLTSLNYVYTVKQRLFWGRKIKDMALVDDPIFVIGHWRSGTTMLHELLVRDSRHTYPNTFDVFAPNHFLTSGWLLKPMLSVLMPKKRPMDDMPTGWERPQEDEFALCSMGARSPYLSIAFPNNPPVDLEMLDPKKAPPEDLQQWRELFHWFLKALTLRSAKRIVVKSPPHTGRIAMLLEMFPRARFIHMTRDPYVLFPSTVNMWSALMLDHGLQSARFEGIGEYVFDMFERLYEPFERDRPAVPTGQLIDVRFEDLTADPMGQTERIYGELDLGDFEQVRPAVQQYVDSQRDYKKNRYEIDDQLRAEIERRWGFYFERYGYEKTPRESSKPVG